MPVTRLMPFKFPIPEQGDPLAAPQRKDDIGARGPFDIFSSLRTLAVGLKFVDVVKVVSESCIFWRV